MSKHKSIVLGCSILAILVVVAMPVYLPRDVLAVVGILLLVFVFPIMGLVNALYTRRARSEADRRMHEHLND